MAINTRGQNPLLPEIRIFGQGGAGAFVTRTFTAQILTQIEKKMKVWTTTTAREMKQRLNAPSGIQQTNEAIANQARIGLVQAYEREVEGRKVHESYRIGMNRYSGGVLKRALQQPSMVSATKQGVSFPNEEILNKEAKHWYRLNFGAGVESPGQKHILRLWGRQQTFSITRPPRPAFQMPRGVWGDLEYKGQPGGYGFYPRSTAMLPGLHTIQGRNYLDGAMEGTIAAIPDQYNSLIRRVIGGASAAGQSAAN